MIEIRLTYAFRDWRDRLRDSRAKAAVARRIDRLAMGNAGDTKALGKGVSELRIDYGRGVPSLLHARKVAIDCTFVWRR
jgi:putative addiction module killer protein